MEKTKAERPSQKVVLAEALRYGNETVWERVIKNRLRGELRSRDIFTYILVLLESDQNVERITRLLVTARKMQVRNRRSRSFGNFHWEWSDRRRGNKVKDRNAVQFCMRGAILIWLRCSHKLKRGQRRLLSRMILDGVVSIRRQHLHLKHTNIAAMSTMNLILIGEAFQDGKASDLGIRRLKEFLIYTWEWGIHEYSSPTYTPIQFYCLAILSHYAREAEIRNQAAALRDLIWDIIKFNWLPRIHRLVGAQCRQDELYAEGDGAIDEMMWVLGFAENFYPDKGKDSSLNAVYTLFSGWCPKTACFPSESFSTDQSWGPDMVNVRKSSRAGDVSLSISSGGFDYPPNQDIPLAVDFERPGILPLHPLRSINICARNTGRCFFVPSDRLDPYTIRYRHLVPLLWTGTQHKNDALTSVFYRPLRRDLLQSNFVVVRDLDVYGIASKDHFCKVSVPKYEFPTDKPCDTESLTDKPSSTYPPTEKPSDTDPQRNQLPKEFGPCQAFAAYRWVEGSVPGLKGRLDAVALRVLWSVDYKGKPAKPKFYNEDAGYEINAARVAITHHLLGHPPEVQKGLVGALMWTRVASWPVKRDKAREKFENWAIGFAKEDYSVSVTGHHLKSQVHSVDGTRLSLDVRPSTCNPRRYIVDSSPTNPKRVLSYVTREKPEGADIGRERLMETGLIKRYLADLDTTPIVPVPENGNLPQTITWAAESGRVERPMVIARSPEASSGLYVWMPRRSGGGSVAGSAAWRIDIKAGDRYKFWLNVKSPHRGHDELTFRLTSFTRHYSQSFLDVLTKLSSGGREALNEHELSIVDSVVKASEIYPSIGSEFGPETIYLGRQDRFGWVPVNIKGEGACVKPRLATVFPLSAGVYTLHLYPRQSGVKINELRIQKVLAEEEPFSAGNSALPSFAIPPSSPDQS